MNVNINKARLWSNYVQGDNKALSTLYVQVFEALLLKAFYLTKDQEEAKDIVADLFTFLVHMPKEQRGKKWSDIKDVESFLFGCVKKKSLAFLRRKQARSKLLHHVNLMSNLVDESKETIAQFLTESLRSLNPTEQHLYQLHFEGYSNHEIAALLKISEKTVRNKLSLSRLKLSKVWKHWSTLLIVVCDGMA